MFVHVIAHEKTTTVLENQSKTKYIVEIEYKKYNADECKK